jgi:membrane-bound ClpP family serine protease
VIAALPTLLAAQLVALAQAPDLAPAEAAGFPLGTLVGAVLMLGLAAVLLAVEFLLVSWGLLAVAAVGSALIACAMAFSVAAGVGYAFVIATPLAGAMVTTWGLARMQRSRAVPRAEITADAGYRHAATAIGVAVGSAGVLVTDAFPAGRARFAGTHAGSELDVEVQGPTAQRGDAVVVIGISGPTVLVQKVP